MKAINDEILKLKDVKVCPNCGEKVPTNSEFCPKCGAKQVTVVESAPESASEVNNETNNQ